MALASKNEALKKLREEKEILLAQVGR